MNDFGPALLGDEPDPFSHGYLLAELHSPFPEKNSKHHDAVRNTTAADITAALKEAGFSKVKTDHHKKKPWLTVLARK